MWAANGNFFFGYTLNFVVVHEVILILSKCLCLCLMNTLCRHLPVLCLHMVTRLVTSAQYMFYQTQSFFIYL